MGKLLTWYCAKKKQVLMPAFLKLTNDLIISHFFVCTKDEVYKQRVKVLWGVICQVFLGWEGWLPKVFWGCQATSGDLIYHSLTFTDQNKHESGVYLDRTTKGLYVLFYSFSERWYVKLCSHFWELTPGRITLFGHLVAAFLLERFRVEKRGRLLVWGSVPV